MDDSETDSHGDALLTFDSEMVDSHEEILNNIGRGDRIGFNATMKTIGTRTKTIRKPWKSVGKPCGKHRKNIGKPCENH